MRRASTRAIQTLAFRPLQPRVSRRSLHSTSILKIIKPFLLSDIGEGIREVQIIQWFVQAGARVEQFDKICEVQSDKASVEITSRFDGVIKKLHYEADDMAEVGKPLIDIDIQGDIAPEDDALTTPTPEQAGDQNEAQQPQKAAQGAASNRGSVGHRKSISTSQSPKHDAQRQGKGKASALATPAVRHLVRQHSLEITDVEGSGRDGRVLKEDVQKYVAAKDSKSDPVSHHQSPMSTPLSDVQPDQTMTLTPAQAAMFKTMTRSLSIPHFLYTDTMDVGPINRLRQSLKLSSDIKLTLLPFLVKALSLALAQYPILNARFEDPSKSQPSLTLRGAHNIGIACDTPQGLVVPVIKSVQSRSISSIAAEAARLSATAREGKLKADEMTGGTFTVSNIGSVGGGVVAPVIVENQAGIVGIGRSRVVPAFGSNGEIVRREEVTLSWSADHRLVDGATMARAAEHVKRLLEEPGTMLVALH